MATEQPPIVIDAEQLARFDAASNHPYACRCELCQEWWSLVPPEDDDEPFVDSFIPCQCNVARRGDDGPCTNCGGTLEVRNP